MVSIVMYCTRCTELWMSTIFIDSNAKRCDGVECSILAGNSCVLDAHTRRGVFIPTPHPLVHCHYWMWLEGYVCAVGRMRACVISRNIVVNLSLTAMLSIVMYCTRCTKLWMSTIFFDSNSNAKWCDGVECRVLAGNPCVLDAQTRRGVCIPTPHV